ncbi:hypothetical protein EDF35_2578 [Rathayibacter sp. PhB151]|uniref:hypothetical protein n=1 Tax=Rathayibacter sp. PhB151 TaxID=2485189 RepID=UPI00106310E1|nr:hypothetical protein [Rathayibacter sp. PhB151]TDX79341.1 hypothetical protein EDF35_2578 [Rathayibacter sp. PhB151]
MTAQNHTQGPGPATTTAGVRRRSLIEVAWTTPVVAAAVAAPGAAASTPSPVADARVVLGLVVGSFNPREVAVNLYVTRFQTTGPGNPPLLSDVELLEEGQVEITLEHDTVAWPDFARLVRPGTHRIVIPAGRYANYTGYQRDGHDVSVALARSPFTVLLTDSPTGTFPVSGTVTSGPIDTVSAALLGTYGRSSTTDTVTV